MYIQAPVTAPGMKQSQEVVNNQVWENHENRKADMELNRIEVTVSCFQFSMMLIFIVYDFNKRNNQFIGCLGMLILEVVIYLLAVFSKKIHMHPLKSENKAVSSVLYD